MRRRLMILIAALSLLASCGRPTAAPAATAAPTPSATAAPTATVAPTATIAPTPAPTVAPTATIALTPAPTATLPGALLLTDLRGRIYRIDPGGAVDPLLEAGLNGALEFDQGPAGLAYALVDQRGGRLELLREGSAAPETLLDLPGREIGAPRWSPDAQQIALTIDGPGDPPAGLYLLSPASGELNQVAPEGLIPELRLRPIAYSPDGARLLVGTSIPDADLCGQMVIDLRARRAVEIVPPAGALTDCTRATWSPDGAQIWLTLQDAGASAATLPGLYRADPASGALTLLLPERGERGPLRYAAPHQLPGGTLGVLVAVATGEAPTEPGGPLPRYTLARVGPDGAPSALRSDEAILVDAAWAPDGSGVVVASLTSDAPDATTALIWWPADGGPALLLAEIEGAYALRWER